MKLYKVLRIYKHITIFEMVYANNEFEVHEYLDWAREDEPRLQVSEVPYKAGCFLSIMVKNHV